MMTTTRLVNNFVPHDIFVGQHYNFQVYNAISLKHFIVPYFAYYFMTHKYFFSKLFKLIKLPDTSISFFKIIIWSLWSKVAVVKVCFPQPPRTRHFLHQ